LNPVRALIHHEIGIGASKRVGVEGVPAMGSAPVADWYRVRDGKITSIHTYFDARPFAPPSGAPA